MSSQKRIASACGRNKGDILQVLLRHLPQSATKAGNSEPLKVLELACGTGEHAAHFAENLPGVTWQPTEYIGQINFENPIHQPEEIKLSIIAWIEGIPNALPPVALNVVEPKWPEEIEVSPPQYDAAFCANIAHITPYEVTQGMIRGASRVLKPGGILFFYGPFRVDGVQLKDFDAKFDVNLRAANPRFGLREVGAIGATASECGFFLKKMEEMPKDNKLFVFVKP